jgi:hypothetical protein
MRLTGEYSSLKMMLSYSIFSAIRLVCPVLSFGGGVVGEKLYDRS